MGSDQLINIFQQMLYLTMAGVLFIVLPSLIVGLIIAIFQAATQINEMTLSFLPKFIVIVLIIAIFAPWMIHQVVSFTQKVIMDIPYIVG